MNRNIMKTKDIFIKDSVDSFPAKNSGAEIIKSQDELTRSPLTEYVLRHKDMILIVILFLLALALRIYSFRFVDVIPTDGTSYVETARAIGRGEIDGLGVYGFYPALIWVVNSFISDGELSARIVSLLFGSMLVVPLYLLGKEIFSRSVAVSACLVAIVWPPLVNSSCQVLTQSTHTTLQLTGVYFVWRAFKGYRISDGYLAGVFFGLTFLTRPEGILLFFMTPIAFFYYRFKEIVKKPVFLWAYSGSFFVFFAINLLLVHHVTGDWQLSAKTDSALNDALSYYLDIPDLNYIVGYEPKGYLDIMREYPGFIWKNSFQNILKAWETIIPAPFWMFCAAGFFSGGYSSERNIIRFFLVSTAAPIAVLIVFYYISTGYVEAYLPVIFLWTASGFFVVETWLKRSVAGFLSPVQNQAFGRTPVLIASSVIYSTIIFAPQIRKDISDAEYKVEMDNGRRAEKFIGHILKESLPPGKIMTRWARIAFYSERDWVNIPLGVDYDGIIKAAYDNGVRFLIIDNMLYDNRPALGMELFEPFGDVALQGEFFNKDPAARVKGLRPFFGYKDQRDVGVIVYELP